MNTFTLRTNYRWENMNNQRYYVAQAYKDLLGDWVVMTCWGRNGTKLGRLKSIFCETKSEATKYMEKINKIRCLHGYVRLQ